MTIAKDEFNQKSRNIIGQISSCVDSSCQGWLVDSFLGKYWIRCKDPKHNMDEVGHEPTPDADVTTATQHAKLGSVIKWDIQQS